MNYYIADTHFCHKNILRYDDRPWDSLEEMESGMTALWNSKVTDDDDVYILGDFCWGHYSDWKRILSGLKGRKYLIPGNHDPKSFPEDITGLLAEEPVHYKEIKDGDYYVILSHYPMISYHHDSHANTLMFYGHVHATVEADAVTEAVNAMKERSHSAGFDYQGKLYNCWCGLYSWAPATLDQIISTAE